MWVKIWFKFGGHKKWFNFLRGHKLWFKKWFKITNHGSNWLISIVIWGNANPTKLLFKVPTDYNIKHKSL